MVWSALVLVPTLIMMTPAASFAQPLRGIAFDSLVTHRPIAGAEVWSPTLNRAAVADSNGRFAFDGVNAAGVDTIELAVYHHTMLDRILARSGCLTAPTALAVTPLSGRGIAR